MTYVVRGKIGVNQPNVSRAGKPTYLAETGDHFYIWDGVHKAAHFASAEAGLAAAAQCHGPWFNVPDATTIESLEWLSNEETILADELDSQRMILGTS